MLTWAFLWSSEGCTGPDSRGDAARECPLGARRELATGAPERGLSTWPGLACVAVGSQRKYLQTVFQETQAETLRLLTL